MPTVIFAPHKDGQREGSLRKQTLAFLEKLFRDDTLPGLHIEPIQNSVDAKVRTGRVNDMFRAVLFKVTSSAGEPHYIFSGVWPHDEAIEVASRSTLRTNPVNGLPELLVAAEVPVPTAQPAVETGPAAEQPAAEGSAAKEDVASRERDAAGPPEAASPPAPSWLESHSPGTTLDRLTDELGIEPDLAKRAMAATSDDELMGLAEDAVPWQGMALLDLAVGKTIEDVRQSLDLEAASELPVDVDEEDRLLAGLNTPVARMQFAWLEDDEELRRVIEGGDFERWRTFLHPEQRKYAERSWNGPFRLTGGAGTGKTVVLLHRARMLARRDPSARVVLTTYTRNLADDIRRQLRTLDPGLRIADKLGEPGIHVSGVDALASSVLRQASAEELSAAVEAVLGPGGNRATGRVSDGQRAWRDAIDSASGSLPAGLRSPAFFDAEYAMVIVPNRVRSRDHYLRARRPGRGVRLGRSQRMAVWDVISRYRSSAAVEGVIDFGEACAIAAELCNVAAGRPADHVLVDEGQDLTPSRWQFLRSLVDDRADDLFIAEDSQQRIYGQHVVLGRLGIEIVGRARRLTLNYRTTQQVLGFATHVLEGSEFHGLEDEETDNTGYRSVRSGPAPQLVACSSLTEELDQAAAIVRGWLDAGVQPNTIGILVRDQRTADQVSRGLDDREVAVRPVTRSAAIAKDPQVMTMHRAKGMEFSSVLIFGADKDLVPATYLLKGLAEEDREDLLQRERSLFYVAATRARDELVVMWAGSGSEFVDEGEHHD